jgi:uncharacterized protein (TIGR03437 family)
MWMKLIPFLFMASALQGQSPAARNSDANPAPTRIGPHSLGETLQERLAAKKLNTTGTGRATGVTLTLAQGYVNATCIADGILNSLSTWVSSATAIAACDSNVFINQAEDELADMAAMSVVFSFGKPLTVDVVGEAVASEDGKASFAGDALLDVYMAVDQIAAPPTPVTAIPVTFTTKGEVSGSGNYSDMNSYAMAYGPDGTPYSLPLNSATDLMITPGASYKIELNAGCQAAVAASSTVQASGCQSVVDPAVKFDQAAFDAEMGSNTFPLAEYYQYEVSPNVAPNDSPAASACSIISHNENTTVIDVQGIINEALGIIYPANDLSGDGAVNIVDAQIVLDAALGLDCSSSATTPASLTAAGKRFRNAGTYGRTIMSPVPGPSHSPQTASVALNVTAPTIAAVVNAASLQNGPISPGEIVTLRGTALGPSTPAVLTLDRTGKVATSLGGVEVSFNGTPAPLTYVSATQINCVVPHEMQGVANPYVKVSYQGQTSDGFALTSAATAPALFTANGSGTGPAAALNQDGSYNSPGNPAAKGSTVVAFMTGEGQTSPAGVTGKVTTVSAALPLTPQPLLPVAVLIGGQPASVTFYGETPGVISGVMQLAVRIPSNVRSGDVPISVSAGGIGSPNGVTVSVRE